MIINILLDTYIINILVFSYWSKEHFFPGIPNNYSASLKTSFLYLPFISSLSKDIFSHILREAALATLCGHFAICCRFFLLYTRICTMYNVHILYFYTTFFRNQQTPTRKKIAFLADRGLTVYPQLADTI